MKSVNKEQDFVCWWLIAKEIWWAPVCIFQESFTTFLHNWFINIENCIDVGPLKYATAEGMNGGLHHLWRNPKLNLVILIQMEIILNSTSEWKMTGTVHMKSSPNLTVRHISNWTLEKTVTAYIFDA